MANVHLSYDQVERAAGQLKTGQTDIEGQLGRLKSLVDMLVSSDFVTDMASGKFQQSYEQWNSGAKNVIAGLEGMSSFLKTAVAEHQALDSRLSQST